MNTASKDAIRKEILDLRQQIAPAERKQKSKAIRRILTQQIENAFPRGANILFFASKEEEVNILPLFETLCTKAESPFFGFFPKIVDLQKGIFEAFPVRQRSQLTPSSEHFELLEPTTTQAFDPQKIDVVLVPAVAIDKHGSRLGFGKGFYDRYLKKVRPDCKKWGVIFAQQRVEKMPVECHDVPVDAVVDEFSFSSFSP